MKVVLFCGGLGLRLRDAEQIPKPMAIIGYRPILWYVMKYFAHYGYNDFILCLGYRGDLIKQFFLNYNEYLSNDFVFSHGGAKLAAENNDLHDWRITFADTGLHANLGDRLLAVQKYLDGEDVFLANYCDGLTDLHLPSYLDFASRQNKIATFLSVRPNLSYHIVQTGSDGGVTEIKELMHSGIRINAGFFVLKKEIFQYLHPGEELVVKPFQRLIEKKELAALEYDGFFAAMDTFKDKQYLEGLYERGESVWEVWKQSDKRGVNTQIEAVSVVSAS